MSGVYLISGEDGSILWQLGGVKSSFVHGDDFTFSFQHHARIYSRNSTHTIVSFLDNASSEKFENEECSSAMLVSLNTAADPMTATLIRRWARPDKGLTWQRGSAQMLANDNIHVSWSFFGYGSEFTWDGKLVREVRFAEERFVEYRSLKFEFEAFPSEPIAVVSRVAAASAESVMTTVYASWNGATNVAKWNLYGRKSSQKPLWGEDQPSQEEPLGDGQGDPNSGEYLGSEDKKGFETVLMVSGFYDEVLVDGVDASGKSLGKSSWHTTTPPPHLSLDQQSDLVTLIDQGDDGRRVNPTMIAAWVVAAVGLSVGAVGVYLAVSFRRSQSHEGKVWKLVPGSEKGAMSSEEEEVGRSNESLLSSSCDEAKDHEGGYSDS
jgi:hypothetical protein